MRINTSTFSFYLAVAATVLGFCSLSANPAEAASVASSNAADDKESPFESTYAELTDSSNPSNVLAYKVPAPRKRNLKMGKKQKNASSCNDENTSALVGPMTVADDYEGPLTVSNVGPMTVADVGPMTVAEQLTFGMTNEESLKLIEMYFRQHLAFLPDDVAQSYLDDILPTIAATMNIPDIGPDDLVIQSAVEPCEFEVALDVIALGLSVIGLGRSAGKKVAKGFLAGVKGPAKKKILAIIPTMNVSNFAQKLFDILYLIVTNISFGSIINIFTSISLFDGVGLAVNLFLMILGGGVLPFIAKMAFLVADIANLVQNIVACS